MAVNTQPISKITVVESDMSFWNDHVLAEASVQEAVSSVRLSPLMVDIGPTGEWGYPLDTVRQENWPLYHSAAFEGESNYDLILIDGRFRISCILQACLHCSSITRILVHDFFNRPQYFVVFPFLHLKEQTDTMALFSINKNRVNAMAGLLQEYIGIYENLPGF
jgi:hypothetical protein